MKKSIVVLLVGLCSTNALADGLAHRNMKVEVMNNSKQDVILHGTLFNPTSRDLPASDVTLTVTEGGKIVNQHKIHVPVLGPGEAVRVWQPTIAGDEVIVHTSDPVVAK